MSKASVQASITAVIGASGTGKSHYVKKRLAKLKPARLMIWDLLDEYQGHGAMVGSLSEVVKAAKADRFKIRYRPQGDRATWKNQFSLFCDIAYAKGKLCLVVEELAFVTSPSWAPSGWSMMTLTGRHQGMTVIGLSQRPASIDKDFFSNCTLIRAGRVNDANDRKTMARVLSVPLAQVEQLIGYQAIERDMTTGKTVTA